MVNFTLVFFKGNNTVDELLQVLEKSVQNGSVYSIPVESGALWLTLITTPATPAPATVIPPKMATRSKKLETWMIALIAAIGRLVFLALFYAFIACCGRRGAKEHNITDKERKL